MPKPSVSFLFSRTQLIPMKGMKRRALRLVHGPMIAVVRTRQNDWGRLEVERQAPIGCRSATERLLKKCWSERAGHAVATTHSLLLSETTSSILLQKERLHGPKTEYKRTTGEEPASDGSASWPPPALRSRLGSSTPELIVNRPSLARRSSRGRLIVDVQARRSKSPCR